MLTRNYSPTMFDAVVRAVANPQNWEEVSQWGKRGLIWNFVDADVVQFCGPDTDACRVEWAEHYKQFDAACAALEEARGEPFPRS